MPEWSNWSGRQTDTPGHILRPSTESDLVSAVRLASSEGVPLRAVGASHSHSRVAATSGVLVDTDGWQGLVSVDAEARTATFKAGTRIFQTGPLLHPHGLALKNQGDIDKQSLAGAISTGTHGTGPTLQNLSASVLGLRLVLASGETVTTTGSSEPELFEVARLSMGGIGLITEIELALRDAYRLHERQWFAHPDEVFASIDELIAATRHFEFFWDPQRDSCACKSLEETSAPPDDLPDERFERIGWSHDIISSIRDVKHTEMEYSLPAEHGPECFAAVRELIGRQFPELQWPVEYRTLAADDLWLSPASGRETVTISVHEDVALDDRPLFEACEEIFRHFDGRPHWGKEHYRKGEDFAQLYARHQDWWSVRDRFDPDGVFLTPALAATGPSR